MAAQIPVNVAKGGSSATGCCTPKEDKIPQKMSIAPKKVLPIIFLPGIMGSNLRNTSTRQSELRKNNNIAWRPDNSMETFSLINASPAQRQLQLDPYATEVDIYGPEHNPTGNPKETSAQRHKLPFFYMKLDGEEESPLLIDDPYGAPNRKTIEQKAMERGWGEILFSSYGMILTECERTLNCHRPWLLSNVLNTDTAKWGGIQQTPMHPMTSDEFKQATKDCWFPVHAMGYNWLRSNHDSARMVSARIRALIEKYSEKYKCEKVILVTHSMGGLLARALIHPAIGNLQEVVLGVVHGVMPATGAPAAYKRMRAGTDEGTLGMSIAARILGNYGTEVTAVLANAQGGLELLPSRQYGNGWLQIYHNDQLVQSLPADNDPYTEIYLLRKGWYRLIRESWINPARQPNRSFERTAALLRSAGDFHDAITGTYHSLSYAHFGVEASRPSWSKIVWNLDKKYRGVYWKNLAIQTDNEQGGLELFDVPKNVVWQDENILSEPQKTANSFSVKLGPNTGPGDQTVPSRSAEHQFYSGKFSGIFVQAGYEHQNSYKSWPAVYSTIYSVLRIISKMTWSSE